MKEKDIIVHLTTPKEGDYVISSEERDHILSAVSDLTIEIDKLPKECQEKLRKTKNNLTSLLYWILNDHIEESDEEGDIIDYVFTHRI